MLYERESDGQIACEGHARYAPMSEADEADWRRTIEERLGHDAETCEVCAEELLAAAASLESGMWDGA
jgi:hypothetical protein